MKINDVEMSDHTAAFKTAEVRDLAWVMLSPGLIKAPSGDARLVSDEWCQETYAAHVETLLKLDENPEPLLRYLSSLRNYRLGFYFEKLLAFWLEHIIQSRPFKKNVPVFKEIKNSGRRTIGEYDFLFGQKDSMILNHWEVTVKFYLYYENEGDDFRWLGPAGQDRLDIKLSRIFEHQLKLAKTAEGYSEAQRLSALPVASKAFIKGYLFYPAAWSASALVRERHPGLYMSFDVSLEHLRGWWLRLGEGAFPKRFEDSRWLVLPKLRWLSAAWWTDAESGTLLDDSGVETYCAKHLERDNSSLLLVEMQRGTEGWFEVSRGFVVASNWPFFDK